MSGASSTNEDQQHYKVALSYRGTKKWVLVYANMPRDELYDTVCAALLRPRRPWGRAVHAIRPP